MKRTALKLSYCFIIPILCVYIPSCSLGSTKDKADTDHQHKHSVTELQADFRQFRQFLEESHPKLYSFTSERTFDSLFDYHYQLINHSMTTQEFYSILIPLVARVGCGHTSLWTPEGYWEQVPQGMFPMRVHSRNGQIFAIPGYNNETPGKPGSRIISINGQDADSMVIEMIHNIWSDGFILTKRYQRLNQVFPYLYALNFGFPEQFEIVILEDGKEKQIKMNPVSRTIVDTYIDSLFAPGGARNPGIKLELVDDQSAMLTIGSFA